jgi:hypothetical protein
MTISSTRFRQILREETKRNLVSTRKPLYESIRGKSFLIIENLSAKEVADKMDTKEGKEEIRKSLWEKFRDNSAVDLGLDLLGLAAGDVAIALTPFTAGAAPIIAMIPDLLNAVRKFARGDKFGGAISLICAIPIAGDAFADFLAIEKFAFKGTEATIAVIKSISMFFREHGDTARKINTGTSAIMKVVAEHLPAAKEHHKDITDTVSALTSGDQEKIIKVAKESGAKIVTREIEKGLSKDKGPVDTSKDNDAVVESRRLRNRKLQIMMGS